MSSGDMPFAVTENMTSVWIGLFVDQNWERRELWWLRSESGTGT